jgi:hypothetical protein
MLLTKRKNELKLPDLETARVVREERGWLRLVS